MLGFKKAARRFHEIKETFDMCCADVDAQMQSSIYFLPASIPQVPTLLLCSTSLSQVATFTLHLRWICLTSFCQSQIKFHLHFNAYFDFDFSYHCSTFPRQLSATLYQSISLQRIGFRRRNAIHFGSKLTPVGGKLKIGSSDQI